MVGFTLFHKDYVGYLLLSFALMALWITTVLIWSGTAWLRGKKVHMGLSLFALTTLLFIGIFFAPWDNVWLRIMVRLHHGPVPHGAAHLAVAAGEGDLKMVKFLIDHSVQVNAQERILGLVKKDIYSGTAVRAAADNVLPFLVEKGADINLPDSYGRTPLMDTCESNDISKVRLLLMYGADTKLRDNNGETAFDIAKRENNYQILKMLDPNFTR